MSDAADSRFSPEALRAARAAGAGVVRHTPVLSSASLSALTGGTVALKAESLQRTGSFKLRGATAKLARLDPDRVAGVVAGSAGNHAQALAYAARARGVPCEVFMPAAAAVSKVAAVRAFGATVHLGGETVDACVAHARERAEEANLVFVHPFDDADVVCGQASVGLELLEDVPDLAAVVVPVGGGGLASGVAMAVKAARPAVRVVGVQAEACAPFVTGDAQRPSGTEGAVPSGHTEARAPVATIADGIAIKRPGELTRPLVDRWVDDVVAVSEELIADAMVLLAERAKLVVEGAGAASVAALLSGAARPARAGTTVAIVSGGNVDAGLLASVAAWAETNSGRRLRIFTRISDRPGGLAALLRAVAEAGGNVLDVEHVRAGVPLHVGETGAELILETRGADHADAICARLHAQGYEVVRDAAEPDTALGAGGGHVRRDP